jgi:hypothetical protein
MVTATEEEFEHTKVFLQTNSSTVLLSVGPFDAYISNAISPLPARLNTPFQNGWYLARQTGYSV